MLFNEPKLLKLFLTLLPTLIEIASFSALQRAEIAEIWWELEQAGIVPRVSVLFNEPKLLKFLYFDIRLRRAGGFSALQRAEIAEMRVWRFSIEKIDGFSALQRAEIAEILLPRCRRRARGVSVLFNEPKLLKSTASRKTTRLSTAFQCSSTSRNC